MGEWSRGSWKQSQMGIQYSENVGNSTAILQRRTKRSLRSLRSVPPFLLLLLPFEGVLHISMWMLLMPKYRGG